MRTQLNQSPYVRAMVRRAHVQILGRIWMPAILGATELKLSDYDLENIGEFTRENVEQWLMTHSGDFQSVKDFRAVCGSTEIEWANPESEFEYCDCFPEN